MEQCTIIQLELASKARKPHCPSCLLEMILGPCWFPNPSGGLARSALAGAGQAGFSSPAGSSALRKVVRLWCITCHLYCCQEWAFVWPFTVDDDLGLSFGTSSVHRNHPNIMRTVMSPLEWDAACWVLKESELLSLTEGVQLTFKSNIQIT